MYPPRRSDPPARTDARDTAAGSRTAPVGGQPRPNRCPAR